MAGVGVGVAEAGGMLGGVGLGVGIVMVGVGVVVVEDELDAQPASVAATSIMARARDFMGFAVSLEA
jgi:hypothetical protein